MKKNIIDYAKIYFQYQQRGSIKQNNQKQTITPTDIFEKWEVNIVELLSITREENKYIIVAIDYFLKWLKARLLKVVNTNIIATFLYKEIIYRFEVLRILQNNREIYFINEIIQRLTNRFRIWYNLLSSYHLQLNGLVKGFNKILCEEIVKLAKEVDQWDRSI